MKVFISWSGGTSHKVALILRDWLPTILDGIEPWVSSEDINKGSRWGFELATKLEESSFGIICVDSSNINSPWLNFEAGALSKSVKSSRIIPFLLDINPSEFKGPLAQFQVATFEKEDVRKLVKSIISSNSTKPPSMEKVEKLFNYTWLELETSLNKLAIYPTQMPSARSNTSSSPATNVLPKMENDILAYIIRSGISRFNTEKIFSALGASGNTAKAKIEYSLRELVKKGWLGYDEKNSYSPWTVNKRSEIGDYLIENDLIK